MVGRVVITNAQPAVVTLAAAVAISSSYIGEIILCTARVCHHSLKAFFDSLVVSPEPHLGVPRDTDPNMGVGCHGCEMQPNA